MGHVESFVEIQSRREMLDELSTQQVRSVFVSDTSGSCADWHPFPFQKLTVTAAWGSSFQIRVFLPVC